MNFLNFNLSQFNLLHVFFVIFCSISYIYLNCITLRMININYDWFYEILNNSKTIRGNEKISKVFERTENNL